MSKKSKQRPFFQDEAEERQFWESRDSSEYVDWSKAERVRPPKLKPSVPSTSPSRHSRESGNP